MNLLVMIKELLLLRFWLYFTPSIFWLYFRPGLLPRAGDFVGRVDSFCGVTLARLRGERMGGWCSERENEIRRHEASRRV